MLVVVALALVVLVRRCQALSKQNFTGAQVIRVFTQNLPEDVLHDPGTYEKKTILFEAGGVIIVEIFSDANILKKYISPSRV